MLSGVKGEPSELSMAFEACKGMSDKGEYEGYGCRRLPLDGGWADSPDGTRGFPEGVEAGGFTSCAACDRHFLIPNGSLHHDHIPMN